MKARPVTIAELDRLMHQLYSSPLEDDDVFSYFFPQRHGCALPPPWPRDPNAPKDADDLLC